MHSIESSCLYDCSPGKVFRHLPGMGEPAMEKGWAWEIAVPFVGGEGCGRPTRGAHTLGDWPVVPTGEGEGTPRGAGPLPFRGWILCLRRNDGENGRGRGWKVPDGCAGRRRRLHRCMWSATADVPHRRRLCDSPELLREMWRRREEISVWGSLDHQKCPTIRRYGGVDSIPSLCGMSLSEGYDGGVR